MAVFSTAVEQNAIAGDKAVIGLSLLSSVYGERAKGITA
jgi:hypothetical protein